MKIPSRHEAGITDEASYKCLLQEGHYFYASSFGLSSLKSRRFVLSFVAVGSLRRLVVSSVARYGFYLIALCT